MSKIKIYTFLKRYLKRLKLRHIFVGILIFSAILVFTPQRITGPLEKFIQPWLVPTSRLVFLTGKALLSSKKPIPQLTKEKQISRILVSISTKLTDLEKENQKLLKVRTLIGEDYILVPARVVSLDSLGLASIEIDRGLTSKINKNQPVIAFIDESLITEGYLNPELIIASGVLIGQVAYTPGPYTARVKLITAKDMRFIGNVIRYKSGKFHKLARIRLEGTKSGKELIARMVPIKHNVASGDLVLLKDYQKFGLPNPILIGFVKDYKIRTDNRLLCDLRILPAFKPSLLDKVYVLVHSKP